MKKGNLYVVSGPSGCGKGTVLGYIKDNPGVYFSVSATTRTPRSTDIDGVTYHFISVEQFKELLANDGVLEHTVYCDNYYGTLKAPIVEHLELGDDVILEIEVDGAFQVKKLFPEAVMVFILPPSMTELERRLRERRTDTEENIQKRLAQARIEIPFAKQYDYRVVNVEVEPAVDELKAIMTAKKLNDNIEIVDEVLEK